MPAVLATVLLAAAAGQPAAADGFYSGFGIGQFDADNDSTFINSAAWNLFAGYELNRFFAVEIQAEYVREGSDTNKFDMRAEFGGWMVSPALLARYPLADDFELFLRAGASAVDYRLVNEELGVSVEDRDVVPVFGFGLRTRRLFLEYVNYDRLEGTYLEQLRAGFVLRF